MHKLQYSIYILLFIILSVTVLFFSRGFLIPIALSGVLAMLFTGLSNKLEGFGIKRAFSALIALLFFLIIISVIFSLLTWQLNAFSDNMENMKERLLSLIEHVRTWLNEKIGISNQQQEAIIKQQRSQNAQSQGNILANFAIGMLGIVVNIILVLVYTYLFLLYRSRIKIFILKLVPAKDYQQAEEIIQQSTKVSQQYLAGLAAMILMLWVLYGIGFSLVGVKSALFFAILCGLLEIIPFVGNITGTSITIMAVIAQNGQGEKILGVVAVYLIVQFFQTYILEPLIVGNQVNINPLFTIMVLVVGESVWGIAGMILAIPLLGIVKIICDHIPYLQPYGYLIGTDRKQKKGIITKVKKMFHK